MISKKNVGRSWTGPREDLEEVALLVAVGLDAELLERVDRHADVPDAIRQRRVVLVRQAQELDAVLAQLADRADDVLGAQRDVLAARASDTSRGTPGSGSSSCPSPAR